MTGPKPQGPTHPTPTHPPKLGSDPLNPHPQPKPNMPPGLPPKPVPALDAIRDNLHAARVLQAHVDYDLAERRRAALQAGAS